MNEFHAHPAPQAPAAPPMSPPPAYPPPAWPVGSVPPPPPAAPSGQAPKPGDPDFQWAIPVQHQPPPPGWTPPKRRGRTAGVLAVGGAILAIVLVRVAMATGIDFAVGATREPLHTPERIGSSPRMTSGEARDIENEMKNDIGGSSAKPQAGVYGRNGRPQYVLAAAYGLDKTGNTVLLDFANGADAKLGPIKLMPGGLVCATAVTDGVKGAACAWASGDKSDGLVWSFTKPDINALAKLTTTARAEVEGATS
jgi:hypothetical protein